MQPQLCSSFLSMGKTRIQFPSLDNNITWAEGTGAPSIRQRRMEHSSYIYHDIPVDTFSVFRWYQSLQNIPSNLNTEVTTDSARL